MEMKNRKDFIYTLMTESTSEFVYITINTPTVLLLKYLQKSSV